MRRDDELDKELRFHIEVRVDDLVATDVTTGSFTITGAWRCSRASTAPMRAVLRTVIAFRIITPNF
jgi:hypothetical protein